MQQNNQNELDIQSFFIQSKKPLGPTFWSLQQNQASEQPIQKSIFNGESLLNSSSDIFHLWRNEEKYQKSDRDQMINQKNTESNIKNIDINPQINNQLDQKNIKNSNPELEGRDKLFKNVFKKHILNEKSGNVIRFFVDLAISFLPQLKDQFPHEAGEEIGRQCLKLRKWHLQQKKNVFKLENILHLFADEFQLFRSSAKISRRLFSDIISKHYIQALKNPRSQVQNKVHYLRVGKVYRLRCRNNILSQRIQSR